MRVIAWSRVIGSPSQSDAPALRCFTTVVRSGLTASWKVAAPCGQRMPVLIGLSGLPSMLMMFVRPFSVFALTRVPQPTAQYGQMLAVCFVPSSLRRAARCPANARSKPSPPSSAAARPAVPIPVSFRN